MTYKLWDKKSKINNCEADYFLNGVLLGYKGDVILIENNGQITNVEMKDVLAQIYEIDKDLSLDDFMKEYFEKISRKD